MTNSNNTNTGWFNNSTKVRLESACEIALYKGHKLFGFIPEDLRTDSLQRYLEKGFVRKPKLDVGVKFIDKKLLEIKQLGNKGGDRLYTQNLYQNEDGDYLAIFDQEGNHNKVKRVLKNSKDFSIIECLSHPQSDYDLIDDCYHQIGLIGNVDLND